MKKKEFSIDVDKDFKPHYEIPADKKKLVTQLKEEAEQAETVWLASDEDREGEAIAWHLYEVLKLKPEHTRRIVFHEITKGAILKAIENPRDIDINLVDAQQARRILDRIVGFELSPVLWKKVKPAPFCRPCTVRSRPSHCRARTRDTCIPNRSIPSVTAVFLVPDTDGKTVEMKAELAHRLKTKAEARKLLESCKAATFTISDITTRPLKKTPTPPRSPPLPCSRRLPATGIHRGTDHDGGATSVRIRIDNLHAYRLRQPFELAVNASRETISNLMGERCVHNRHFATKTKGAQEAHEAIRPTYMENAKIERYPRERLYDLIWKRTIASHGGCRSGKKTTVTIAISNERRLSLQPAKW